jgi:hypothetical protein
MRLERYLSEKYIGIYPRMKGYFDDERLPMYMNPTSQDMKMFQLNGMRFIADGDKKNVFVWDEEVEIHYVMFKYLVKKGYIHSDSKPGPWLFTTSTPYLSLQCVVDGSKMRMVTDIQYNHNFDKSLDWKWLDKYFNNWKEVIYE